MQGPTTHGNGLPQKLIADAKARINAARYELNTVGSVDLSELERIIQDAMVQVAGLPRAEAIDFKGAILALHDELDSLGKEIERVRDETRSKLKDIATGRKMAAAYGGHGNG